MGKTKIKIIEETASEAEVKIEAPVIKESEKTAKQDKKSKVSQKKGTAKTRGKKYQQARELVDSSKKYPLKEAVELAQKVSYSKFLGTLEIHLNTNAKNLRGLVTLPFMAGKKMTVLAFGQGVAEAGADLVGTDETIEEIAKNLPAGRQGKINFDVLVTTPVWMPKLAKVAKILGPKGLMPNPKNGTITDNLAKTITELRGGKTEYKSEPNGPVIHLPIGKVNQQTEEIAANIRALYNAIGRTKIKKIVLSPTMGLGVKVDLSSI